MIESDWAVKESDFEYVGFWIRVVATIIDSLLLLVITLPAMSAIYGERYSASGKIILGFWDFIFTWVLPAVVIVLFWIYKQATPGKMVFRAKIVDEKTGNVPKVKQWILRYIGYFPSILALGLGFFWVGWDKKKQGWHDKLAGTVVIRPRN